MSEDGKSQEARSVISKLINLVLTNDNYQLNDENYLQIFGTAMGTKMAPCFAYLLLGKLEIL